MVALVGGVIVIAATGGAAGPAFAAGASAAINTGVGVGGIGVVGTAAGAATGATAVSAATAVGASAAVGAAGGAMVGAGAAGAGTAAVAGAVGGAATGAASASAMTSIAAGVLTGPIGWTILGADEEQLSGIYTFDCWKAVLHDESPEPSNGRLLRDVVLDPRVKQVTTSNNDDDLPNFILKNLWDEQFRIEYVSLVPNNRLFAHAVKVKS